MTRKNGFTLLELIITIAIAGILATIAVPAFNNSIARSRLTSNTNQLVGALNLARAEAIDRGEQVTVRPFGTGGFEVVTGGGVQVKVFEPSNANITITTSLANVVYNASGIRIQPASADSLLIEDSETGLKRRVCVSVSGSISLTEGGAC